MIYAQMFAREWIVYLPKKKQTRIYYGLCLVNIIAVHLESRNP